MGNFIIDILNWIISSLGSVLSFCINLLPNSPFKAINNSSVIKYLNGLNWIIPFGAVLSILELWLTCIIAYYIYSAILRWIKLIE